MRPRCDGGTHPQKDTLGTTKDGAAAAGLCLCAAVLLYHIPLGDSVAADALHACLTAGAALACLVARGRAEDASTRTGKSADADGAAEGSTRNDTGETAGAAEEAASVSAGNAGYTAEAARRVGRARRRATAALAALCLLAAIAGVAGAAWATGDGNGAAGWSGTSPAPAWPALAATLLASCVGTAVWEEALFRRLLPETVEGALETPGSHRLQAACICAALFAMLHLGAAPDGLAWGLRAVQVFCFALAMSGTAATCGRLAPAVAAHALYDLICFAPAVLGAPAGTGPWDLSAQTLATLETDVVGMVASLAFLVPAALLAVRELRR